MQTEFSQFLNENSEPIGNAFIRGELYDLGHYPGVKLSKEPKEKVFGQLLKINNSEFILKQLDLYEGVGIEFEQPSEYLRLKTNAYLNDSQVINCWVYVYNYNINNLKKIESGDYEKYFSKK